MHVKAINEKVNGSTYTNNWYINVDHATTKVTNPRP